MHVQLYLSISFYHKSGSDTAGERQIFEFDSRSTIVKSTGTYD